MPSHEDDTPAWMTCVDILNKAKVELITEAMDTLNNEISEKRIEVNGSLITLPERPNDADRDMFIITRMLEEAPQIKERYGSFIQTNLESKDANVVMQVERGKKFLMALEQIELLINYSTYIDEWMQDASVLANIKDPSEIMARTIAHQKAREEILVFMLESKTFVKEEIFTDEERRILSKALKS
ncbi:MAG TPA: hypothetical protein VMV00_03110 [Candidatus Baltobacteraceae bacterium]|nr:hypothetical protein [Candidatus Baltobacteraceae bacterium]